MVHVKALQIVGEEPEVEVCSASGQGCATLMAVGVEPPPPAAARGPIPSQRRPLSSRRAWRSCRRSRSLYRQSRRRRLRGRGGAARGWTVTATSSSAGDTRADMREQELEALKNSWETAQPGRAAKAKEARDKYIAEMEAAAAAAAEPAAEEGEVEEGAERLHRRRPAGGTRAGRSKGEGQEEVMSDVGKGRGAEQVAGVDAMRVACVLRVSMCLLVVEGWVGGERGEYVYFAKYRKHFTDARKLRIVLRLSTHTSTSLLLHRL